MLLTNINQCAYETSLIEERTMGDETELQTWVEECL